MLSRRLSGVALLACGCLVAALAGPAASQDAAREKPLTAAEREAKARSEANAEVVAQITLAHDLADQGRKARSPLALVSAAEILRKLKEKPAAARDKPVVEVKDGGPAPKEDDKGEEALDPEAESVVLLQDARDLADRLVKDGTLTRAEAAAVKTLADKVARIKVGYRGASGGPQQRSGFLNPGVTHTYRINFNGLSPEYVRVFGTDKTVLQVSIHNSRGVLRGIDTGHNPGGTFYGSDGPDLYTIRISNIGNASSPYRMITN
jgi:hypothetical protein